jgi:hypothetical protein
MPVPTGAVTTIHGGGVRRRRQDGEKGRCNRAGPEAAAEFDQIVDVLGDGDGAGGDDLPMSSPRIG